jgi:hypothetical protein
MIHWKSLALVLSGILLGCAANVARTAHAGSSGAPGGGSAKCYGPSQSVEGLEEDSNRLLAEGYRDLFTALEGYVVCGVC